MHFLSTQDMSPRTSYRPRLLSKPQPLCWVAIWFLVQTCNHCIFFVAITRRRNLFLTSVKDRFLSILTVIIVHRGYGVFPARSRLKRICNSEKSYLIRPNKIARRHQIRSGFSGCCAYYPLLPPSYGCPHGVVLSVICLQPGFSSGQNLTLKFCDFICYISFDYFYGLSQKRGTACTGRYHSA